MKIEFGFYQVPSSKYDPNPPNCQIIKWHKKVGDKVKQGDPLLLYEADKVGEIDLLSSFSGTIISIHEWYLDEADDEGRLWVWDRSNKEFKNPDVILHLPELGFIETEEIVVPTQPPSETVLPAPPKKDEEGASSRVRAAPAPNATRWATRRHVRVAEGARDTVGPGGHPCLQLPSRRDRRRHADAARAGEGDRPRA